MNSSTGRVQLAALMGADQGRSGRGGGKDAGGRLARQRLARTGRGRLGGPIRAPVHVTVTSRSVILTAWLLYI